MRPDMCHVLLGPMDRDDPKKLYVHVDPAHKSAWTEPALKIYLDSIYTKGGTAVIVIGDNHFDYPYDPPTGVANRMGDRIGDGGTEP